MSRAENTALTALMTSAEGGGYTLPAELVDVYRTYLRVKDLVIPSPPMLDADTAAARIVAAVAAGTEADLTAMAVEVAEIELSRHRHAEAQHILRLAVEQAADKATLLAADLTEKIITEHLRPALDKVHEQAREVRTALDGYSISHPHDIVTAPAKVRNAYGQLSELVARRSAIFTARTRANIIGHREFRHDASGLYGELETPLALSPSWRSPARIPPIPAPIDPTARLLWVISPEAAIAKPWLPTRDEQDAAWLAQFGEQRARNQIKAEHTRAMF